MISSFLKKYKNLPVSAKAGFWFVICSCVQSGIKFIASPIFANMMTVEQYGLVTVFTSWFSIIYIFATLSFGSSNGVFYVAMVKYPKDRDGFTSSLQGLLCLNCVLCFVFIGISVAIFGDWMGIGMSQYSVMCIELIGYGFMLIWSLRMRYENKYISLLLITLAYSVGTVLAPIIALLFCNLEQEQAIIKNTSAGIMAFVVGLIAFLMSISRNKKIFNKEYWKFALSFNIPLIPHYLSNVILVQSDRIMIANMVGEAAAAIYSVAYNLGVTAQVITQALVNAINPWMYKKIEKGEEADVKKTIVPLVAIVGMLILGVLLIMPEVFNLLFPSTYMEALNVIPPVASGVMWAFIYNIYASVELYYMGNRTVSIASMTGALLNLILNFICIPIFGYMAAAYTTLICDMVYAFMHSFFATRQIKKKAVYKNILPNSLILGIGGCVTALALIIMFLYPYIIARYLIVVVLIAVVLIKRDYIMKAIKFKH
ncbi:MAG: oligosaccharide flippase family protein [Lachnospiraceae bacterium]|nr:oligosaccharide flippase family protein [Lachnospiraceae bacterium]